MVFRQEDTSGNLLMATRLRMMVGYLTRGRDESCGCLTTGEFSTIFIDGMDDFLHCSIVDYQNLSL